MFKCIRPFCLFIALTVAAASADAATLTVTSNADNGPGSLRQAVLDANASPAADTIDFAVGGTISLATALPSLTGSVTISGPGAANLTISGAGPNTFRLLTVASGATADIGGLTLTNGAGIDNGGTMTLHDAVVTGNSVDGGGGGVVNNGAATIEDCVISNNSATGYSGYGAGIRQAPMATLVVRRSTLSGNYAEHGGGAINGGLGMTIESSTLANNSATQGGAINIQAEYSADVTIRNCTITGNVSRETYTGGGITQIVFYNRTLTSTLHVINTTIAGNQAGGGGGIYSTNWSPGTSTVGLDLLNTIIAGNTASIKGPDLYQDTILTASHNLIGTNADHSVTNGVNGNQVGTTASPLDPILGPLTNNGGPTETLALGGGSPAVNAGTAAGAPANDQRGAVRDALPDIGSFEVVPNLPPQVTAFPVSATQGAPASVQHIADVSDSDQQPNTLTVTATPATGSGITLSALTIDASGHVTATVAATCTATDSTFTLTATDSFNASVNTTLHVSVNPAPAPQFTQQPQPLTVCVGSPASFSAFAGNGVTYSWLKNGSATGHTGSTFSIGAVNLSDQGSYSAVASNACATSTSQAAALTVNGVLASITAPAAIEAGASCTATVPAITPVYSQCGSAATSVVQQPAAGTQIGIGTHPVTITITDIMGNTTTLTTSLTVTDHTPPVVQSASVTPNVLWPPNHEMVPVTVSAIATDGCGSATCHITSVTSNEPDNGLGDGDVAPDWQITGGLSLLLRAERSGKGIGRLYTVTLTCTDTSGNATTRQVTVTVPKSNK